MGLPLKSLQGFGVPAESYGFANKQLASETIPPLLGRASPLRTAHLRDPVGPQIQFASESFIDEIAAAVSANPVAFRLRYLTAPRDVAVVKAAAKRAMAATSLAPPRPGRSTSRRRLTRNTPSAAPPRLPTCRSRIRSARNGILARAAFPLFGDKPQITTVGE